MHFLSYLKSPSPCRFHLAPLRLAQASSRTEPPFSEQQRELRKLKRHSPSSAQCKAQNNNQAQSCQKPPLLSKLLFKRWPPTNSLEIGFTFFISLSAFWNALRRYQNICIFETFRTHVCLTLACLSFDAIEALTCLNSTTNTF
jgi:hypothetical protein